MILRNLMEEKQLDLNQPLLSVRRFSLKVASEADNKRKTNDSSVRLPPLLAYKSELKSGPVSNPGTVPFIWEQTPGRPKDESKSQTESVEQHPITPNLPPGRVSKVKQKDSDQVSKGSTISNSQYVISLDKNVTKHESPEEAMQEKASSDSADGDEAYQDALDTLSRTESSFMNCSVSGLSGLDDQEFQPSGNFARDQQGRNFMIGRFLPAAKAVASGTPQYTSRKPPVALEQPRQVKEVVNGRRYSKYRQIVLSHSAQDIGKEESEDEDDNYNGSENYEAKVCGLFPGFCLLNPISGFRMEDRVLSSAAHGMKAKSTASQSETGKEHARTAYSETKSVDSQYGFREDRLCAPENFKNGIDPHRRGCSKLSACESTRCESGCSSPLVEKTLYVDSVHKGKSNSSSYSSEVKGQTNHRQDDFETLSEDGKRLNIVDEKVTLQPKSSDMQMIIKNHSKKSSVISSQKVAQCTTFSENLVTGNQENSDGPIQNNVSWRSLRLAGVVEVDSKSLLATKSIDQECTHGLTQDPGTLPSSKVVSDAKMDLESQWLMRSSNQENLNAIYFEPPLAIPLPKAPSESWLKRTLPTMSSRNLSSRSYVAARSQIIKTASLDPKWETIVKSSKELLTPIPED